MDMHPNVGRADQVARVAAGLILLGLTLAGVIGLWGLIGLVPLLTGLVRVCPAYSVLGLRTCSTQESRGPL